MTVRIDCHGTVCSCCEGCDTNSDDGELRAAAIKAKLETISFPIAGEDRVKALDWITNSDRLKLSADSSHLVDRYILAVFYYALDGDNWDVEENEISWLSGLSHCYWLGITCTAEGAVMNIDMGKSRMILWESLTFDAFFLIMHFILCSL